MHECIPHDLFFKIYLGILQIQHLVKGAESRVIQNQSTLPLMGDILYSNEDATRPKPRIVYETKRDPIECKSDGMMMTRCSKKGHDAVGMAQLYSLQRCMNA